MTFATRLLALMLIAFAHPPQSLCAHSSPNSELRLSAFGDRVEIDLVLPASDYAAATGAALSNESTALRQAAAAIAANLGVSSHAGAAWQVTVKEIELVRGKGPPDLKARIVAVPRSDQTPRAFVLNWRLFSPDNPGGLALVVLANDPSGAVGPQEIVLGAMTSRKTSITVDLGKTSALATGTNAFLIGAHHILEGYDHLLFLLALMLPAPLLAFNGRWQRPRTPRSATVRIILTVTGFTLGHSVTFFIASIWPMSLSVIAVESVIAASVLVSALHAIRPLFAASEPLIGSTFGLVHGLAFATLFSDSAFGTAIGGASLIGFTLGIEAIQLALVICVMPVLILLAQNRAYTPVRVGLASMILLAACLWLANRLFGFGDGAVNAIEAAISFGIAVVAALSLLVIAELLRRRLRARRAPMATRRLSR